MKFSVTRAALLKPLQLAVGVVERRQTQPILGNLLLVLDNEQLSITGTNGDIEIIGRMSLATAPEQVGAITVPARKFMDICRSLPDDADIHIELQETRLTLTSGRGRYQLSTLPADGFPDMPKDAGDVEFVCAQNALKHTMDSTAFAMAHQDVRYYLNGMLWEVKGNTMRAVATDGHRLALSDLSDIQAQDPAAECSAILPRKGVLELQRLLDDTDAPVTVQLGDRYIRVSSDDLTFTSRLVDGKFPDYNRVLPKGGDKTVFASRPELRQALSRTAILSNEKYRGVRFLLSEGLLTLVANNPEQEEAQEELAVDYQGTDLDIGFNVSYLQDVTNVLDSDMVEFTLADANSSVLLKAPGSDECLYVVMPMRL